MKQKNFAEMTNEEIIKYLNGLKKDKICVKTYKAHYDSYEGKSLARVACDYFLQTYDRDNLLEIVDPDFESIPGAVERVQSKVHVFSDLVNRTIRPGFMFWRPISAIPYPDQKDGTMLLKDENFIFCYNERFYSILQNTSEEKFPMHIKINFITIGPDKEAVLNSIITSQYIRLKESLVTANEAHTKELKEHKESKKDKKSTEEKKLTGIFTKIDMLNDQGLRKLTDYLDDLTTINKYIKSRD